jgi:hypothetical protein
VVSTAVMVHSSGGWVWGLPEGDSVALSTVEHCISR